MTSTILVSGATGYLGSNIVKKLIHSGHRVVVLKRKKSNMIRLNEVLSQILCFDVEDDFLTIFNSQQVDVIIHAATAYGVNNETNEEIYNSNVVFPKKLLLLARDTPVKYFINIDTVLSSSTNLYANTKAEFRSFFQTAKVDLKKINVYLEYFYGPNDSSWKLIPMLLNTFLNNKKELALTKGNQERAFLHIVDLLEAFDLLIKHLHYAKEWNEIYINPFPPVKIKELVLLCKKLTNNTSTELLFGSIPERINEIVIPKECKNDYFAGLGWKPTVNLESGIKMIIQQQQF